MAALSAPARPEQVLGHADDASREIDGGGAVTAEETPAPRPIAGLSEADSTAVAVETAHARADAAVEAPATSRRSHRLAKLNDRVEAEAYTSLPAREQSNARTDVAHAIGSDAPAVDEATLRAGAASSASDGGVAAPRRANVQPGKALSGTVDTDRNTGKVRRQPLPKRAAQLMAPKRDRSRRG